jgi:5-methylthioribose kinase
MDIEHTTQLIEYLQQRPEPKPGEVHALRVLPGGVSNRTVLIEFTGGSAWVIKQALPKLRVEVDWFSDPARIEREALAMQWLGQLAPRGTITALVFVDPHEHLLAMEAVAVPHVNWKNMLLAGDVQFPHVQQFAGILANVHRKAADQAEIVQPLFADRSFFESLRLEPYYEFTGSQVPAASSFLAELVAETRSRAETLVHGDYSPKNVLVHNDRLVLLDHEVAHWGDPAFDLGFALTHFLSKSHHLPPLRQQFLRAVEVFFQGYSRLTRGRFADIEHRTVRHTLACLLARVAGRSPLEYLAEEERARQREAVLKLLGLNLVTISELLRTFAAEIA